MPIFTDIADPNSVPTNQRHQRLHGYLKLDAATDGNGRTRFTRKAFKSPIHISKPYWTGHSLLLNVMSPTAGLLQGDHIDIEVNARAGSSLTLSNPAALRIHKMEKDQASLRQEYNIDSKSFLELNPEWLIPQAHSRFDQQTRINVEARGEILFIEAVAPGRVAYKESFAFNRFRNHLTLTYDSRICALEHYSLEPGRKSNQPWQSAMADAFYVSLYLVSEKIGPTDSIWRSIYEMQGDELSIGSSQLASGPCWNVKLLTPKPILARRAIEQVRELFYTSIDRPISNLRRQ